MTPFLAVVQGGIDRAKDTENFLLSQPDVIDASVWLEDGRLTAQVTLQEGSHWTEKLIKLACAKELGLASTPSDVLLMGARSLRKVA